MFFPLCRRHTNRQKIYIVGGWRYFLEQNYCSTISMIMQGVRKKKTILFISYYRQLKSYKIHFLLIKFDGGLNKYEVCNYYIRFDHFLLPMQCTGNLDCFWWGKRAAIIRRYPAVFVVCFAFYSLCAMFSWLRTISFETYSFKTDGFGIFNIRKHLGAFRTHEVGEGRGVKHKHVCTRAERKGDGYPAPPGDRNHWATYVPRQENNNTDIRQK